MSRRTRLGALLAAALVGAAVAALWVLLADGAAWPGLALGAAVCAVAYALITRRARRRLRVASAPFPEPHRELLEREVAFYRELGAEDRARFEREVAVFLDEQTVTGPRGAPLDDELRLLVAASAVVVVFGRRGFRYPRLRDIVVYDQAFDEDYAVGGDKPILGMVHAQGPILFSAASLRQGFRGEHDGRNVGYHEFAHVLDFDRGQADGVPGFMPWGLVDPWLALIHAETDRIESHRSVLREYAATNQAEFFAVATEVFFERPEQLRARHPELYALLAEAYAQDPAAPKRA